MPNFDNLFLARAFPLDIDNICLRVLQRGCIRPHSVPYILVHVEVPLMYSLHPMIEYDHAFFLASFPSARSNGRTSVLLYVIINDIHDGCVVLLIMEKTTIVT